MQATIQITARRFTRQVRFGLVGVSGIVINSTALWLLVRGLHLAIPFASVLATEMAIVSNFLLNDRWTFGDTTAHRSPAQRFVRFNGVALGGMAITALVLTLLTHYAQLNLLTANVLAVGAATIWNYVANSRWTWSDASHQAPSHALPADCGLPAAADEELTAYWLLMNERDEVTL